MNDRYRDTEKSKTRGASDAQKHDNQDNGADDGGNDDLINYKGIYFNDNNEKYIDDSTGAHFRYDDIYQRLLIAKVERNRMDKELNISYSSQNDQNNDYGSNVNRSRAAGSSKEKHKRRSIKNENRQSSKTKSSNQTTMGGQKRDSIDR